jgi:hypothetical protein
MTIRQNVLMGEAMKRIDALEAKVDAQAKQIERLEEAVTAPGAAPAELPRRGPGRPPRVPSPLTPDL